MIAHLSIDANDPRRVAQVLTDLWRGKAMAFPVVDGAWIVLADDDRGSAIEVYPRSTEMTPGVGEPTGAPPAEGYSVQPFEVQPRQGASASAFGATHVALQTPLEEREVKAIAAREGWRSVSCDRGPAFRVIELWLENRVLIELLTPSLVGRYRAFMQSDVAGRLLNPQPTGPN